MLVCLRFLRNFILCFILPPNFIVYKYDLLYLHQVINNNVTKFQMPPKIIMYNVGSFPNHTSRTAAPAKSLQSCLTDSVRPHRRQPTGLHCPWDSPGKDTGVGCHFLLQCIKVKSESEVAQSCPTLSDPIDGSPPGSPVPGFLQARTLEWVAISFPNA